MAESRVEQETNGRVEELRQALRKSADLLTDHAKGYRSATGGDENRRLELLRAAVNQVHDDLESLSSLIYHARDYHRELYADVADEVLHLYPIVVANAEVIARHSIALNINLQHTQRLIQAAHPVDAAGHRKDTEARGFAVGGFKPADDRLLDPTEQLVSLCEPEPYFVDPTEKARFLERWSLNTAPTEAKLRAYAAEDQLHVIAREAMIGALAIPPASNHEKGAALNAVLDLKKGTDESWDPGGDPQVGRASRRATARNGAAQFLCARLSGEYPESTRTHAAIALLALAARARGESVTVFCGGGGYVAQVRASAGSLPQDVASAAHDLGPNPAFGLPGIDLLERMATQLRASLCRAQNSARELTDSGVNAGKTQDAQENVSAHAMVAGEEEDLSSADCAADQALSRAPWRWFIVAALVLAAIQASPFYSETKIHFAMSLAFAATFPFLAILFQIGSDEEVAARRVPTPTGRLQPLEKMKEWLSELWRAVRVHLASLLFLEALAVVGFIWIGLHLYEPSLKWHPLKRATVESSTFWAVVNPSIARLSLCALNGEIISPAPSDDEKLYLSTQISSSERVVATVFSRHFVAVIVWTVGLRLLALFIALHRRGGSARTVVHAVLFCTFVFFAWLSFRLAVV